MVNNKMTGKKSRNITEAVNKYHFSDKNNVNTDVPPNCYFKFFLNLFINHSESFLCMTFKNSKPTKAEIMDNIPKPRSDSLIRTAVMIWTIIVMGPPNEGLMI